MVKLIGEFDLAEADDLRQVVTTLIQPNRLIEVDMAEVTYFGSRGLSSLVDGLNRAEAVGGGLRVVAVSDQTRSLLQIAGLLTLLAPGAEADRPARPLPPPCQSH